MDDLLKAVRSLVDRLTRMSCDRRCVQDPALEHLKQVLEAAERGDRLSMDHHMGRLNQFWLQSVPWCSDLSKEIEKIVIRYKEQTHSD